MEELVEFSSYHGPTIKLNQDHDLNYVVIKDDMVLFYHKDFGRVATYFNNICMNELIIMEK